MKKLWPCIFKWWHAGIAYLKGVLIFQDTGFCIKMTSASLLVEYIAGFIQTFSDIYTLFPWFFSKHLLISLDLSQKIIPFPQTLVSVIWPILLNWSMQEFTGKKFTKNTTQKTSMLWAKHTRKECFFMKTENQLQHIPHTELFVTVPNSFQKLMSQWTPWKSNPLK